MDTENYENKLLYRKKGGLTKLGEITLIEKLSQEGYFNEKELKRLTQIYKKYIKESIYMEKHVFLEFLHNSLGFTEEFFMNRAFLAADLSKDGRLDLEEFLRVTGIMLRGSKSEKIKFCFSCYDLNDNMVLSREEVILLLNQSYTETSDDPDVNLDMLEMVLRKLDQDEDGVISFEEYKKAALDDWLLMECFGQCLPDDKCRAAFMVLLETTHKIQ